MEKLIEERRGQIEQLIRRREQLATEISKLDEQMNEFLTTGKIGRRTGRRVKNGASLRTVVIDVLAKNKKGLSVRDIAQKVKDTGYKSNSRKFENVVYQCLYHTQEIVHDESTGLYRMKK